MIQPVDAEVSYQTQCALLDTIRRQHAAHPGDQSPLLMADDVIAALVSTLAIFVASTKAEHQSEYVRRITGILPDLIEECREQGYFFPQASTQ